MEELNFTSREFRSRQAHVFDLADKGNRVIIHRSKHQTYMIIPLGEDEQGITPALQAKIDKAREEYKRGETRHFDNVDEVRAWMDAL